MTDKEVIRAEVQRLMDEEMHIFEQDNKSGDGFSCAPVVYTRLQMLLTFIDSLPLPAFVVSEDLRESAKTAFPDLKREYYPTDKCYKEECLRLIDLRSGFKTWKQEGFAYLIITK